MGGSVTFCIRCPWYIEGKQFSNALENHSVELQSYPDHCAQGFSFDWVWIHMPAAKRPGWVKVSMNCECASAKFTQKIVPLGEFVSLMRLYDRSKHHGMSGVATAGAG